MIWLSRRGLIWIEAIAWTVPTASMTIGIDFGAIEVVTTGTGPAGLARPRRPCGCADAAGLAPCSAALAGAPRPSFCATSERYCQPAPQSTTPPTARPPKRTKRIEPPQNPHPQAKLEPPPPGTHKNTPVCPRVCNKKNPPQDGGFSAK